MKTGVKHLVKCRCVMAHLKNMNNPPVHHFIVFSELADDKVVVKYAQCNNCGSIHKVTDICTSEIIPNKEEANTIMSVDEIKLGLPTNLVKILELNDVDLPTWEMASFYFENKMWGNFVVLTSDYDEGNKTGKYLQILGESLFKVNSFTRSEVVL